jgi:predicted XRE-type DNA-binding protein
LGGKDERGGKDMGFFKLIDTKDKYIKRFWGHIDVLSEDECWQWLKGTDKDGYGIYHIKGNSVRAHRFSYLLTKGAIPEGMLICHSCDNRKCCNPKHLWYGTGKDNSLDMASKQRQVFQKNPELAARGETQGSSKLHNEDVIEIRQKYQSGGYTQQELASIYRVSQSAISAVVRNKYWIHLQ